ncbi:dihydrodipicolinate synthase family protein, partial [Fusicatenibacter saccharivorans]|nr:dihydrodipicolinate synthase family protein [Fusicatenibacter saccharivorans]
PAADPQAAQEGTAAAGSEATEKKFTNAKQAKDAQKLAKQLVADGADGLVVNGTTGESPVTHMDEKVNLVKAVKEVVDVPVISGAGSNDTAHTV